jgi:hypothetical protein
MEGSSHFLSVVVRTIRNLKPCSAYYSITGECGPYFVPENKKESTNLFR